MKILWMRTALFSGLLALSLGAGNAAWAHEDESETVVTSAACVPFTIAKEHEEKAKEEEDKAKEHEEELAKEAEDDGDAVAAAEHEEKAKEHEEKAKEHEEKAKEMEDETVATGYVPCTTPGGAPGLMPVSATTSTGSKAYREIHGQ